MRELIAYFRSKADLQTELLKLKRLCLMFKYNIRDLNSDLIRLEAELKTCQEDLARERRISSNLNNGNRVLANKCAYQDKLLAPFIRSPWGMTILELPWHEHAGFLEAFFGRPREEAYAEHRHNKSMEAAGPSEGCPPTGESK